VRALDDDDASHRVASHRIASRRETPAPPRR
jgi:hypothetical protein